MLIGLLALFVQLSSFFKYGNIIFFSFFTFLLTFIYLFICDTLSIVLSQVEWNSFVLQFQ